MLPEVNQLGLQAGHFGVKRGGFTGGKADPADETQNGVVSGSRVPAIAGDPVGIFGTQCGIGEGEAGVGLNDKELDPAGIQICRQVVVHDNPHLLRCMIRR